MSASADRHDPGRGHGHSNSNALSPLKVGAFTGTVGVAAGGAAGVWRRAPRPGLRAAAVGIQWGLVGVGFTALRPLILSQTRRFAKADATVADEREAETGQSTGAVDTPEQRRIASALAAGVAGGAVSYTLIDRRRLVRPAVLFALAAVVLQTALDLLTPSASSTDNRPLLQRLLESRWSLMRRIPDEEYVGMLGERVLGVEVELGLVEERMGAVRREIERLEREGEGGRVEGQEGQREGKQ